MKRLLLILGLLAVPATGQFLRWPPTTTVANLPAGPADQRLYFVSDGTGATDCAAGGGATAVLCWYDGSSWVAISSGAHTAATNWDTIGDPSAGADIAMANTFQTLTWDSPATSTSGNRFELLFDHDSSSDLASEVGVNIEREATAGTAQWSTLLNLNNADTDGAVDTALNIASAAGTITTAIDASDPQIGTALAVGANPITTGGAEALSLGQSNTTAVIVTTDSTGDAEVQLPDDSIGAAEILDDSVTLTTHTTGFYVASITDGAGMTGGDGGSEGAALTLAATLGTGIDLTEIEDICAGNEILERNAGDTAWACISTPSGGGGEWTDDGTIVYPTETTDDVVLGAATAVSGAKFSVDGDADQIQALVQANATQTAALFVVESSAGADYLRVDGDGTVNVGGATATPTIILDDSDSASETSDATIAANATDAGAGTEDVDVTISTQVNSTLTARITIDADGNTSIPSLDATGLTGTVPDASVDGSAERDEVCDTADLSSACLINASVVGRSEIDETLLSMQTHATDCTALTCDAGSDGELCFEQDANTFYVCDGSGTPAWQLFDAGAHTTEINDLSAAVTWANVPDANVDGSAEEDEINHDNLVGFVAAEHVPQRSAADCTTETGGVTDEICLDSTAGAGTGLWRCPSPGDCNGTTAWERVDDTSGSGAPTDADYLVGTANGSLSAEIVVGTTPGGELGGTWGSPTIDDSVTVATWTLTTPTITLLQGAAPTPTAEGDIQWETDDDHILVGDGVDAVEFVPTEDVSGDVTMTTAGAVSLADDVVAAAEMADADHGAVSWSGGVATVEDLACTTCVDISGETNLAAGRSLTLSGDSVEADAELYTDTKCMTIETPADADNFLFFRAEAAITVTGIDCLSNDGTSAVITVQECDGNGGSCGATEAAITCGTTNTTEATSIDDAAVDAGDWMRVDVGTVTGSTQVAVCTTFTWDD